MASVLYEDSQNGILRPLSRVCLKAGVVDERDASIVLSDPVLNSYGLKYDPDEMKREYLQSSD